MLIDIPEDRKEKRFGVWWMSTEGRPKVRWHHTFKEAYARYNYLRTDLFKDASIHVKIKPNLED